MGYAFWRRSLRARACSPVVYSDHCVSSNLSGSEPVRVREVAHAPSQERMELSGPWHPFQITAWFFIAFFTVAHYGFLVFYTPGTWRIFGYVVSSLTLLSVLLVYSLSYRHAGQKNYWLLIAAYMDRIYVWASQSVQ